MSYDLRIYLQIQSSSALEYLENVDNFCHHVKSKSDFFSLSNVLPSFFRPIWNTSEASMNQEKHGSG